MALIGIDSYTPSPGTTGASQTASTPAASAQANTTGPAANAAATGTAGPQPLNNSGPRGTAVNIVA